jgi:hypothetical protein
MYLVMDSLKTARLRICAIAMVAEIWPVGDHMEQSHGIISGLLLCIRKGA